MNLSLWLPWRLRSVERRELFEPSRVLIAEVLRAIGYDGAPPPMTEVLQHWAAMTVTKRDSVN